jgi:tyrosine-protein kinase Etk/Wzc
MALAPIRENFDAPTLVNVFQRVWREKWRIAGLSLAAGLVALGIAFLMPKWYRATATILPPEDADIFTNLSIGQRALSKFPAFGVMGDYFTPADVFRAILRSTTVQIGVMERFDLQRVYKLKSAEKTLKTLGDRYDVKLAAEGTISVSVEDKDPKRAAAMAMGFLEELDRYNIHNRNSRARRAREFLEQRVREADSLLRVNEAVLREYQERTHTVAPRSVSGAGVQSAADLMARKIALEVELGVLRTHMREDASEIRETQTELDQLKRRIATLPALQSDLARMVREQMIQEQVFVLLTTELEQARIRETMDTPTVQVLDRALPPEKHVRPRRAVLAILTTMMTFFALSAYVGFRRERPSSQ